MESREAALDCCRSEPFMENPLSSVHSLSFFGLRLSLAVIETIGERDWIIGRLLHIGNTSMSMAKHMPSFTQVKSLPGVVSAVEAVDALVAE